MVTMAGWSRKAIPSTRKRTTGCATRWRCSRNWLVDAMSNDRVIAIDGPAGSGKSTAARRLAEGLGYTHLNTGAMYRAVAFLATEGGFDLDDPGKAAEIAAIAHQMKFEYRIVGGKQRFIVNGDDHTDELFRAT